MSRAEQADPTASAAAPPSAGSRSLAVGAGARWRRYRGAVAVIVAMVAVAVVLGLVQSRQTRGFLDPAGIDAGGSRALVSVLEDHGVDVSPARTVEDAVDSAGPGGTVVVTTPDLLRQEHVDDLIATGADIVLVAPATSAPMFHPELTTAQSPDVDDLPPRCDAAPAESAGVARLGGLSYRIPDDATGCYPVDGVPTLVIADLRDGATLTVVGSGEAMTNEYLDAEGNAALMTAVLGRHDSLTWYRPTPEAIEAGTGPTLTELFPPWVVPVAWQLAIAAALAALWRARRLGRLVPESLPVVVRASETTEGRARLYRRGRSRAHAAAILREAAATRLRNHLRQPAGTPAEATTAAIAERTGRHVTDVAAILTGAPPTDDAGLVRLADDLDTLEKEVRTP